MSKGSRSLPNWQSAAKPLSRDMETETLEAQLDLTLRQWIERYQPSMVISGHVHQSPFIPDGSWFDRLGVAWVFNTGLQSGRPPTHIVIDIDEGTAFWLAAGDEQCLDLNAPLQRPAARIEDPPAWLTSLGRISDPSLARPASATG